MFAGSCANMGRRLWGCVDAGAQTLPPAPPSRMGARSSVCHRVGVDGETGKPDILYNNDISLITRTHLQAHARAPRNIGRTFLDGSKPPSLFLDDDLEPRSLTGKSAPLNLRHIYYLSTLFSFTFPSLEPKRNRPLYFNVKLR